MDVEILRVGIDPSLYEPAAVTELPLYATSDAVNAPPIFGIFARVVPEKAQDRVIEAVASLHKKSCRVHLIIVGGPLGSRYYDGLVQQVARLGIADCVTFVPPQVDPRPWYKIVDVVTNSRLDAEPFGLSIVEAMLMQKPVLAYNLGGPSETVVDGQTGWLIHSPSAEAYEAGLVRALRDRAIWNDMGRRGRARALREYTTEVIACQYLGIVDAERRLLLQRRS